MLRTAPVFGLRAGIMAALLLGTSYPCHSQAFIEVPTDTLPPPVCQHGPCIKPWTILDRWDDQTLISGYPEWRSNGTHDREGFRDINDDGFTDLVCHYVTTDIAALDGESSSANVNGELLDGTPFEGIDSINIVKDMCA